MKYKAFVKLVSSADTWHEIPKLIDDTFFLKRQDYLYKEAYKDGYHYHWYKYPTCNEVIKYTEVFDE